jgi:hypothetical protein
MKETVSKLHEITPAATPALVDRQWLEDDSINLVDLWLELSKRKHIILSAIVVALATGSLIALFSPTKYSYTTSIALGTKLEHSNAGDTSALIEEPQTVLAKIQESYIPLAQQQYRQQHAGEEKNYQIEAHNPKGSQLIVIQAKGAEEDGPAYLQHLQMVTNYIVKDHQHVMDIERGRIQTQLALAKIKLEELTDPSTLATQQKQLEAQLNSARIKLDELQDPRVLAVPRQKLEGQLAREGKKLVDLKDRAQLIQSRYERLDETDKLLSKQIAELESQIDSALKRRDQAISNITSDAAAMTMLLIDNEIQQNRTRLAALQERLQVKQQDQRQELEEQLAANRREQAVQSKLITQVKSELSRLKIDNQHTLQRHQPEIGKLQEQIAKLVADNKRAVARQKQAIAQLENQLTNFQATRALAPPMRSLQSTGLGKSVIVLLALFLGLALGIFAAFFAAFLDRVKLASQHSHLAASNR